MKNKFKDFWRPGDPGTVATKYLSFKPRRRPKGVPGSALLATLLDPRSNLVQVSLRRTKILFNFC
jgi:hypothetical protein